MRTAALVDERGHIVWLCLPHFDGEPVFAALIAGEQGGFLVLGPAGHAEVVQRRYRSRSTVLETTWRVGGARLVLTEGMVAEVEGSLFPTFCLVRRLEAHGGVVDCSLGLRSSIREPASHAEIAFDEGRAHVRRSGDRVGAHGRPRPRASTATRTSVPQALREDRILQEIHATGGDI
jgi:hypothetical protein